MSLLDKIDAILEDDDLACATELYQPSVEKMYQKKYPKKHDDIDTVLLLNADGVYRDVNEKPVSYQKYIEVSSDPFLDDSFEFSQASSPKLDGSVERLSPNEEAKAKIPHKFQPLFPFNFNRMQCELFEHIYESAKSCVVSAPTGSGKTVLFELAIIRLFRDFGKKAVYLAPLKSICNERYSNWRLKFSCLDIRVEQITGDTRADALEILTHTDILIATPEKWESLTRKWHSSPEVFLSYQLLLLDEVHALETDRGYTLEAVTTRMLMMNKLLRVVALSATISNFEDIALWIQSQSQSPCYSKLFDDTYRAVNVKKKVFGYSNRHGQEYQFDNLLNSKLLHIIKTFSEKKPTLVFCPTRNSTETTAEFLVNNLQFLEYETDFGVNFENPTLSIYATKRIAFHHAGLSLFDRAKIESLFISNKLNIVCCTTTLASGVNLPAYLVVIKGTKSWLGGKGKDYSESEILQMMGRAGRPQFETSGMAIIMTTSGKMSKYNKTLIGCNLVESVLLRHIKECISTEIALRNINSLNETLEWLQKTFLYVRFHKAPSFYPELNHNQKLSQYTASIINYLLESKIIEMNPESMKLRVTKYGSIMTRKFLHLETTIFFIRASVFVNLESLFRQICSLNDFKNMSMKNSEKGLYNELRESAGIRFPPKGMKNAESKVFVSLQQFLGKIPFPIISGSQRSLMLFEWDQQEIVKQVKRVISAIIDIFLEKKDSASLRLALELDRSIHAGGWEDSLEELKQIQGVEEKTLEKLVSHQLSSIKKLSAASNEVLECILKDNSSRPSDLKILSKLPKIDIDFEMTRSTLEGSDVIEGTIKLQNYSEKWRSKLSSYTIVCENFDGILLSYERISFKEKRFYTISLNHEVDSRGLKCYVFLDHLLGFNELAILVKANKASELSQTDPIKTITSEMIAPNDEYCFDLRFLRQYDFYQYVSIRVNEKKEQDLNAICGHNCEDKTRCSHTCCLRLKPIKIRRGLKHSKFKMMANPYKTRPKKCKSSLLSSLVEMRKTKRPFIKDYFADEDSIFDVQQTNIFDNCRKKAEVSSASSAGEYSNLSIAHNSRSSSPSRESSDTLA